LARDAGRTILTARPNPNRQCEQTSSSGDEARSPRPIRVELTVRTAVIALVAVTAVWLFVQLWPILLVIIVALMVVGMLNPLVGHLEHRGLKRGHGIAAVFVGLLLSIGVLGALTLPQLAAQLSETVGHLPQMQTHLAEELDKYKLGAPLAQTLRDTKTAAWFGDMERAALLNSSKIIEIGAYAATSLFLAMYLIVDRDRMRGAAFALVPRAYHVRASRVLLNLEAIVGGYMRGQVITSALMACFTFTVLSIAHVSNALALATFAGLADVLPYVGALLACGPAFLAALPRGTTVAVVVLAMLAAYQEFESRVVVPRVYGKVLRLPAATVVIALLIGGKLLGILGALLALPAAAGLRMILEELRVDLPGEDVDDTAQREQDMREQKEFELRTAGAPAAESAAVATEIARAHEEASVAKDLDTSL
jgi:predicted PurR-regulated permease PerM